MHVTVPKSYENRNFHEGYGLKKWELELIEMAEWGDRGDVEEQHLVGARDIDQEYGARRGVRVGSCCGVRAGEENGLKWSWAIWVDGCPRGGQDFG